AVDARLVREEGRAGRYAFSHALIRDTLYGELSAARRVRLHARLAAALEAADPDGRIEEIAHHRFAAAAGGDLEPALIALRRAGDRAAGMLAYEEAAAHYGRALELREDGD